MLKDNKGSAYIELTISVIIFCNIIAIFFAFAPIITKINELQNFANYTARLVSLQGEIDNKVYQAIDKYKHTLNIEADIDFSETEFMSRDKIQLNDEIVVKINSVYVIKIMNMDISIPITAKAISRSEVYHK